jgi:hypothetical protein
VLEGWAEQNGQLRNGIKVGTPAGLRWKSTYTGRSQENLCEILHLHNIFFLFEYHKITFRCFSIHHIVMRSTSKPPYLNTGSLEVAKT